MAFKLKYNKSSFPFKPSPHKLFGGGKPGSGYGSRPGERWGGKATARADARKRKVDERRGPNEDVKIETFMGKDTRGHRTDSGEYKMGWADMKIFGGVGKKNLRAQGLSLEGDHEKHVKKNRRKRDRLKKKGKVDSWGDRIA